MRHRSMRRRTGKTAGVRVRESALAWRRLHPLIALLAVVLASLVPGESEAQVTMPQAPDRVTSAGSRIHPPVILRDAAGALVVRAGTAVSTTASCGPCHDVVFIQEHTTHGPEAFVPPAFSTVPRDLPVPGGAAPVVASEPNCFVCHLAGPDPVARTEVHRAGHPDLGPTASLTATGLVTLAPGAGPDAAPVLRWDPGAFDGQGAVEAERLGLREATAGNCATCHGMSGAGDGDPLVLGGPGSLSRRAVGTGEVWSGQRLSESGVNLVGKAELDRSWDVHAERLLECADCHASSNNPVHHAPATPEETPAGLTFDPRRLSPGAWMERPSHLLAGTEGEGEEGAPLSCSNCHDAGSTHAWLPYAERHTQSLTCEACHTPALHAPALASVDWTLLDTRGEPTTTWRGCQGGLGECDDEDPTRRIAGWEPALLAVEGTDGRTRLAPHNLVATWYWAHGDRGEPVPMARVREASIGATGPDDVRRRLEAAGFAPVVAGRVEARAVHHGTTGGDFATRECAACHSQASLLAGSMELGQARDGTNPDGATLSLALEDAALAGHITGDGKRGLVYRSDPAEAGLHVLGHRRVGWANGVGIAVLLATLLAVLIHGGARVMTARSRRERPGESHGPPVYVYSVYERVWHWLQATAILLLLGTGLEIHMALPGLLSFELAVRLHNALGFVVVANALLAAFYHLASGEIRHYLPHPRGFFEQAIVLARHYLVGHFRGEPHPFARTRDRKLNPLQQITYLAILNLLLPLQIVTGLAMWGAQRWPAVDGLLGGLTLLAPLHALGAWLFAAFLLMHVYLTTTGPTPTAHIQAMVAGWDGAEVQETESSA